MFVVVVVVVLFHFLLALYVSELNKQLIIFAAYNRILTFKKPDGSYGAWKDYPTSNW